MSEAHDSSAGLLSAEEQISSVGGESADVQSIETGGLDINAEISKGIALESFVPSLIMDKVQAFRMKPRPYVDHCEAAVVLADISGFTPLTERLSQEKPLGIGTEKLSMILNSYFGKMIEIVYSHGGDIVKFAGDALLIIFQDKQNANNAHVHTGSDNYNFVNSASKLQHKHIHKSSEDWKSKVRSLQTLGGSCENLLDQSNLNSIATEDNKTYGSLLPAAIFERISSFSDESTDKCMRCNCSFKGIGDIFRRHCNSCGSICCKACSSFQVFELTSRNVLHVCDYCSSVSPNITSYKVNAERIDDKTVNSLIYQFKSSSESESFQKNSTNCNMREIMNISVKCCLKMQKELDNVENLRLHIGIGVGSVYFLHVGGVMDRWEFLMAGDALRQMSQAEAESVSGEVCVSQQAWSHVAGSCQASNKRRKYNVVHVLNSITDMVGIPTNPKGPLYFSTIAESSSEELLRINEALVRYVPGSIRDRIELIGTMSAVSLAELRKASILFVNLPCIDYNASSSGILMQLQTIMETLQNITYLYEGSIRQFIMDDKGTTMIIVFGLYPFAHENDPLLATECAIAIESSLKLKSIACKIGVSTGKVFAGTVGSSSRCEYAVIGDAVNLSARLMAAACRMEDIHILCDEDTRYQSQCNLDFITLPPMKVKGKKVSINISYPAVLDELHGSKIQEGSPKKINSIRPSGHTTSTKHLIGHEEAIEKLHQNLDRQLNELPNTSSVAFIEGPLGIGKSKLIRELVLRTKEQKYKLQYLSFNASSLQKFDTWSIIYPFLFQVLLQNQHYDDVFHSVSRPTSPVSADQIDNIKDELYTLIQQILREKFGSNEANRLKKTSFDFISFLVNQQHKPFAQNIDNEWLSAIKGEFLNLVCTGLHEFFLNKYKSEGILTILIVESMHFLDQSSWDFIHKLIDYQSSCRFAHLFFLFSGRCLDDTNDINFQEGVYKTERSNLFNKNETLMNITLQPLSKECTHQIILKKLGSSKVSNDLLDLLYSQSGGNPLYLEETLKILNGNNMINFPSADGCADLNNDKLQVEKVFMPDTLLGIMSSKIDALQPQDQWLLKLASVIGVFDIHVQIMNFINQKINFSGMNSELSSSSGQMIESVQKGLKLLVESGFLVQCSLPKVECLASTVNTTRTTYRSGLSSTRFITTYSFKIPLIREAAYSMLLHDHRKSIHQCAADYLEEKELESSNHAFKETEWYFERNIFSKNGLSELYSLIGKHRANAMQFERSVEMFAKAAKVAFINGEYRQVIQYLRCALSIQPRLRKCFLCYKELLNISEEPIYFLQMIPNDGSANDAYAYLSKTFLALKYYEMALYFWKEGWSEYKLENYLELAEISISEDLRSICFSNKKANKKTALSKVKELLKCVASNKRFRKFLKSEILSQLKEISRTCLHISKFHLENWKLDSSFCAAVQSIKIALLSSQLNDELAQGFIVLGHVYRQLFGDQNIPNQCLVVAQHLVVGSGNPFVLCLIDEYSAYFEIGCARWKSSTKFILKANSVLELLRDNKRIQEGYFFNSLKCFMQGNLLESKNNIEQSLRIANAQRDLIGQIKCLAIKANINIKQDTSKLQVNVEKMQKLLSTIEDPLPPVVNLLVESCEMLANSLQRTLTVKLKSRAVLFDKIYFLLTLNSHLPFESLLVFVVFAEVAISRLERQKIEQNILPLLPSIYRRDNEDVSNQHESGFLSLKENEIQRRLTKLFSIFQAFSRTYPAARPSYKRLKGTFFWACGKTVSGFEKWKQSESSARKLDMKLEQALAHYEMARHFMKDSKFFENHLYTACSIFEDIQAKEYVQYIEKYARIYLVESEKKHQPRM